MFVSWSVALIQVNAIGGVAYRIAPSKVNASSLDREMAPLTVYPSRLIGLFTLIVSLSILAEKPAR